MKKNVFRVLLISFLATVGFMTTTLANTGSFTDEIYVANAKNIGSYNVVAFDSVLADQSAVEGAVAVKNLLSAPRNATQNYTIGTSYSGSKFQHIGMPFNEQAQPVLLLEKNQLSKGLFVLQGDVAMSTTSTYENVNSAYEVHKVPASEISDMFSQWQTQTNSFMQTVLRAKVGDVMSGGSTNSSMGKFTFNSSTNVNNIAVSVLPKTNNTSHINEFNITPEVNAKDYIVIYSDATNIQFGSSWGAAMYNNQIINYSELYTGQNPIVKQIAEKVIFVFPNATTIDIKSFAVPGSILAPNAHITGYGGSINGQVITKTLEQKIGFDIHNFIFRYFDSESEKFDFNDVTVGSITAEDFTICHCDLQTVTDEQLITLANVNAVDSAGNVVQIVNVDRSQIAGQDIDGAYPITFKTSDNQTITVNATLYHKNYIVNANNLSMTAKEYYKLSKNEIIEMANLTVTSPSGVVPANQYRYTTTTTLVSNKVPAVGTYDVEITVDNCFKKTITITITPEPPVQPVDFKNDNFQVCFCDMPLLTDAEYIALANIKTYNATTNKFDIAPVITEVDRTNLLNATTDGVYDVTFKTADNKTYVVPVYLYTKGYMVSAMNVRYDIADFDPTDVVGVFRNAHFKVYDPRNEKFLTIDEMTVDYTPTLVDTYVEEIDSVKYNVKEYDINTAVDTCYKSTFKLYITEKIEDKEPIVEPVKPDINKLPQTGSDYLFIALGLSATVIVIIIISRVINRKK